MRSSLIFALFAVYSVTSNALDVAGPSRVVSRDLPPLNPPESAIINHNLQGNAAPPQTNARRLAAGLPPLPPKKRWDQPAKPPKSSPGPCKSSLVKVCDAASTVVGYLSNKLNDFGEYNATVVNPWDADALKVCVSSPSAVSHSSDIKAINSYISSLPFLGVFKGYVSTSLQLNSTSAAYLFLGQVAQTGPGALPSIPVESTYTPETSTSFGAATGISEEWESNVWRVDPVSKEIQLWWTNPDATVVQAQIIYIPNDNLFAATGSPTLFGEAFSRTVDLVKFYLA